MKHRLSRTIICIFLGLTTYSNARADSSGRRVNPNVILLLDTGEGMNWGKVTSTGTVLNAEQRWEEAIEGCKNMNSVANADVKKSSWMIVREAMLGSMSQDNAHCFYSSPDVRPGIKDDTISGITETNSDYYQAVSDFTTEYREDKSPHLRMVNCFDPRLSGNRGDWNEDFAQCIGDISSVSGSSIVSSGVKTTLGSTQDDYWCLDSNMGTDNNGRDICFDFHRSALNRNTDGILARYEDLARFSVMTFDNQPGKTEEYATTWNEEAQHAAGWDYGDSRKWYIGAYEEFQQGVTTPSAQNFRYWNAGIRGPYPYAVGRLVRITSDLKTSNELARRVIDTTEPVHCSVDGAMFDDFGEYVYDEPEMRPAYVTNGGDLYYNCRPRVAFYITDGIQTDPLEFPQAYCDDLSNTNLPDAATPNPPWEPIDNTKIYKCPYNSTIQEAREAFEVVNKLASTGGFSNDCIEPMYLVVIGVNMKDKDELSPNRCGVAPVWVTSALQAPYCKPNADDCIQIQSITDATECVADAFVTPRQYLNKLALAGWPADSSEYNTLYADAVGGGLYRQPPWRDPAAPTQPLSDSFCDDAVVGNEDNCGGEDGDLDPPGALFVDSPDELAAVIDMVLNSFTYNEVSTRTEIASTDITANSSSGSFYNSTDEVQQYVFNSGYQADAGAPWSGFLFRQGYTCTQGTDPAASGGAKTGADVDFAEVLKAEVADRKLYVLDPTKDADDLMPTDDSRINGFDYLVELKDNGNGLDDCELGAPNPHCENQYDYYNLVMGYLYGTEGKRVDAPLGDIYNSTPFILPPPREQIPIASYHEFKSMEHADEDTVATPNYSRQPYLYTGTNDGILHSFNVFADSADRIEGWGYLPSPLVNNLALQFPVGWEPTYNPTGVLTGYTVKNTTDGSDTGLYQHVFGVDGPPRAANILLYRSGDANEKNWWRSIVVGGLGKGGYGYYCLDVTANPENKPTYRWQLSETLYAANAEDSTMVDNIKRVGMGVSRPELSYVYIDYPPPIVGQSSPTLHEEAIAILPGGLLNDENHGIETSTGVYMTRLADGTVLRYLQPDVDDDLCDPSSPMFDSNLFVGFNSDSNAAYAKTAQLIGEPIVPNSIRTGKVNDEAFIGDDRGRIWRIDMSEMDPNDWCLEPFFDTLLAEHYPYKDCLEGTGSTPSSAVECCDAKNGAPTATCTDLEIQEMMGDNEFAIDACSGAECLTPAYPFPRIPMLSAPTLVQDTDRNLVMVLGSGHIDGLTTLNHNRIFSITVTPTIEVAASSASLTKSQPDINWWLGEEAPPYTLGTHTSTDGLGRIEKQMVPSTGTPTWVNGADTTTFDYFGLGEKLIGRPSVFNEVVYFTTYTPLDKGTGSRDACEAGGGKIWGVNFNDPTDFGQLPIEGDPANPARVSYWERPDQMLTGARLVRRPSCEGTEGFALMVQKAQPDAAAGSTSGTVDNAKAITSESINIPQPSRGFTRVGIDSWSIVLGGQW